MRHPVQAHTRVRNGRTEHVRQHTADSPEAAAQRKRHAFERRVAAEKLREKQAAEATYETKPRGTPGERRPRKSKAKTRAKQHLRKALRHARKRRGLTCTVHLTMAFGILAWHHGRNAARLAHRAGSALWTRFWSEAPC